ncbi:MAG: ATP-binding cassette domain-containing protein [Chitinivibrionales bacterium]|nr:ATP-binding cassette domain-containing protein [Chitinivibrionales bacterium]
MVNVTGLTKKFPDEGGEIIIFSDISFSIAKGELIGLTGVSGSGKTTLLHLLGGLDKPTNGTIEINGRRLNTMSRRSLAHFRSTSVGFVFQFHHLLPDFNALENVLIPGLIARKTRQQCIPRAAELLDIVGLSDRARHFPGELSGGERQRVALARALFNQPSLILADEPTGNLDKSNSMNLLQLFQKAHTQLEQTFIVATHNDKLASRMGRNIHIEDGKVRTKNAAA